MNPETKVEVLKVSTMWAAVGITSWAEAAQSAAAIYSLLLIADFVWKRFLRSHASRWWPSLFPPRRRRRADFVHSTGPTPME